jgi:hypothetical protein
MAIGLYLSDGGSAEELAIDHTEDPAPLVGDEDASWVGRFVTAITSMPARFGSR